MPTQQLTHHFTLGEFTISETAARRGIPNTPQGDHLANVYRIAVTMEKVRVILGHKPILISSGYRSPDVNAAVGGSSTSAHMSGLAVDFTCPGFGDPLAVCHALVPYLDVLEVDQLIYEFAAWVHLGIAGEGEEPRCMTLTIDSRGTRHGIA